MRHLWTFDRYVHFIALLSAKTRPDFFYGRQKLRQVKKSLPKDFGPYKFISHKFTENPPFLFAFDGLCAFLPLLTLSFMLPLRLGREKQFHVSVVFKK
jgi:hypothetical protein